MNVVSAAPLYATLLAFVAAAIAIVVILDFFFRPKMRTRFPGGVARYVFALIVQAAAFMLPVSIVAIALLGIVPTGVNFLLGLVAGFAMVALLHFLPGVGPLLRDLRRTRLDLALESVRP